MSETKEDILDDIVRSSRLEERDLPKLKQVRLKKNALKKIRDSLEPEEQDSKTLQNHVQENYSPGSS